MDILLVAMADVTTDARTLNAARALAHAGYSVGILASGDFSPEAGIMFIRWTDPGGRALRRWYSLKRAASQLAVQPAVVGAMDFFALSASMHIARRSSAKLFYDAREFYFALGPLSGHWIRQRVITFMERRAIQKVDEVVVSGPMDAVILQRVHTLTSAPTVLLNSPPYADAVQSSLLRDTSHIPQDNLVLLYQGVVHHGRGIAPAIRALVHMPDVHLCVVGDGPAVLEMQSLAAALNVQQRVHWIGTIPYDELHRWTCSADIGLCCIEPISMSYEYALPNKFFEYMRARIPQIVSDLPALRDMMQQHPVGTIADRSLTIDVMTNAVAYLRDPHNRRVAIQHCEDIRSLCYERQRATLVGLVARMLERR